MSRNTRRKTPKSRRIALIDADTVLFAVACNSEVLCKGANEDGSDIYLQRETIENALEKVLNRFQELVDQTKSDGAFICLSDAHGNFRYNLLTTYKANRSTQHRPAMIKELREKVSDRRLCPWPVVQVKDLEADDVCGISSGALKALGSEAVICSPDKDLRTIPGLLWNNRTGTMEEITQEEADRHHLYQTLIGDTVDNYTGCPGVGPVRAKAILAESAGLSPKVRWEGVLRAFVDRGYDQEYCLTQARVARILRAEDWDAETKEIKLWEPPTR